MTTAAAAPELPAIEVLTENEQNTLGNVSSTSKVGVFRLIAYVVAVALWTQQKLNDIFRRELEGRIAESRPFTKAWYEMTARNYQHGNYPILPNGGYAAPATAAEIQAVEASKVIDKAAVVQTIISGAGALRIKIATDDGPGLKAVPEEVRAGFEHYMELMGAAGVFLIATTAAADDLLLNYKIYFDPLVLDSEGRRLDGTNDTPVETAVRAYLKSVDFNGVLSLVKLTDVIQKVDGVTDPFLLAAASKYGGFSYADTNATGSVGPITEFRRPESGYFDLDEGASDFRFVPAE